MSHEQFVPYFPRIPPSLQQTTIFDRNNLKYQITETCNCGKQQVPLDQCPHMQNVAFKQIFNETLYKLNHIEQLKLEETESIRTDLFTKLIQVLEQTFCDFGADDTISEEQEILYTAKSSQKRCHIYNDLQDWFPADYEEHFAVVKKQKREKEAKFLVVASFSIVIVLLVLKVVAIISSNSMALMTSLMDTALDVCSGIVLLLSLQFAKKGVPHNQYKVLTRQPLPFKFVNGTRFEALGVLCFAIMMGTISVVLIGESFMSIIDIADGESEVVLDNYTIGVMAFNIVAKLILCIWCHFAIKRSDVLIQALTTYRDDHRNDTMSNSIGLLGVCLAKYLGGYWGLCDPIAAIILSVYILYNWSQTALEILRQFTGEHCKEKQIQLELLRLLYQFDDIKQIDTIKQFLLYQSGEKKTIEIRLIFKQISVQEITKCLDDINNMYEAEEGIERCILHIGE